MASIAAAIKIIPPRPPTCARAPAGLRAAIIAGPSQLRPWAQATRARAAANLPTTSSCSRTGSVANISKVPSWRSLAMRRMVTAGARSTKKSADQPPRATKKSSTPIMPMHRA